MTSRRKDLIVLASGKKVAPDEVEQALRDSEAFRETCVLGRALDPEKGEEVCAVVVPSERWAASAALISTSSAPRQGGGRAAREAAASHSVHARYRCARKRSRALPPPRCARERAAGVGARGEAGAP